MPYENELVALGVKSVLETNLGAMLDTVEAEWAAVDPITLPDPVTWWRGMGPVILELYGADFPFVGVIAPLRERDETRDVDQIGYAGQVVTVYVHGFVYASAVETANSMAYRYGDAICRTMLAYGKAVEGWGLQESEPRVELTEVIRHPLHANADMQKPGDVGWLQGVEVRLVYGD